MAGKRETIRRRNTRSHSRTTKSDNSSSQSPADVMEAETGAPEEESVQFTWRMTYSETNKFLSEKKAHSEIFFGGPKSKYEWQLEMRRGPLPRDAEDKDDVGAYASNAVSLYVNLRSFGKDADEDCEALIRFQVDINFTQNQYGRISSGPMKDPKIVSVSQPVGIELEDVVRRLLNPNGYSYSSSSEHVRIACLLFIEHPVRKTANSIFDEYRKKRQLDSLTNFMKSIMTDSFADVTLKMGDEVCRVHKCILAGRSKVFAAMFTRGMKEGQSGIVEIEDEPDIVKAMINYMYCGDIAVVKERPYDMLKIADKYELLELKDECEKFIVPSLTVKNAGKALLCAYEHNLKSAMPEIMRFVNRNRAEISKTKSLNEVFKQYPQLILDLYLSQ